MNTETIGAKLAAAMVKVQAEIKVAVKGKDNPFFKTKYADLGAVWEACHEALTSNEVAVIQSPVVAEGTMRLKTTLVHVSGESMSGEYLILPVKNDPQAYGSAVTYARRYSLAAMVGIIQEDDDGAKASTRGKAANMDKVKGPELISAGQRLALRKVWLKAGKTDSMVASYLQAAYEIDSTAKIKASDYQDVMAWCAEPKPIGAP